MIESNKIAEWIREAVDRIPTPIRRRIENVAFVIEPEIRLARPGELPIMKGAEVLGLYQGVPLPSRAGNYTFVPPDKITIFSEAIERVAGPQEADVKKQVQKTVWHEVGHYLGMNEKEVRAWERRRNEKNRLDG